MPDPANNVIAFPAGAGRSRSTTQNNTTRGPRLVELRLPVYDLEDNCLGYAWLSLAQWLIDCGHRRLGTKRKVRGIRLLWPVEGLELYAAGGKSGNGQPHRNETIDNPANVYTFDRIPGHLRGNFENVLSSVTKQAA